MLHLLTLDREPLSDAHTAVVILAHQRDIVIEHCRPFVGLIFRYQSVGNIVFARSGDHGIHPLGGGFQLLPLEFGKVGEVVVRFLVGHARTAILHVRVALRNQRIRFLGVTGVQVFVQLLHGQTARRHFNHHRLEFGIHEVLCALCRPAVEQLLLLVWVDLFRYVGTGGTDRF